MCACIKYKFIGKLMSCYNIKQRFIYILLLLSVFVSGCSDKKTPQMFKDNIKEFNEFATNDSEGADKLIVFSDPFEDVPICKKASLVAKGIKINQLAALLSDNYDVEISYALNIEEENTDEENKDEKKSDSSEDKLEVNFNNVCLQEVLDTLTDVYNIGVIQTSTGYQIYQSESQTITYELNYHNFQRKGSSSITIASSQLSESAKNNQNYSTITSASEDKFWDSISDAIASILHTTNTQKKTRSRSRSRVKTKAPGQFYVYKEAGLIVVTGSPKEHKNISNFLKKANANSVRQVMIEAKILEVTLNDEFATGIQWDLLKGNIYQNSFAALGEALPNINNIHNTPSLSTKVSTKTKMFSGGAVKGSHGFNVIMQALSSQGQVSVMSSPKVSALNNQRALIKSGEDQYFITNVSNVELNTGAANNSTASKSSFNIEPLFSGIALDTTPNIISSKEILLHIHPMISRISTEKTTLTSNGAATELPVAKVKIREVDTVVKAKSGDIVILGGMTEAYAELNSSQLPLQPTQGFQKIFDLFSSKRNHSTKTELIILLKPTIVEGFSGMEKLGDI